jgi:hypothetical protein
MDGSIAARFAEIYAFGIYQPDQRDEARAQRPSPHMESPSACKLIRPARAYSHMARLSDPMARYPRRWNGVKKKRRIPCYELRSRLLYIGKLIARAMMSA